MRRVRPKVSGVLIAGFLLGLASLWGCGNPEEGSAPKLKGSRDEVQKAIYKTQPDKADSTKKP